MGLHVRSQGQNPGASDANTIARTTWPLAASIVIILGVIGLLLLTQKQNGQAQTIGEAMLTISLVTGPFLWAEWMVNRSDSSIDRTERDDQLALVGRDLRNRIFDSRELRQRVFVGCNLSNSQMNESDLTEAVFDRADLRHVVARGSNFTGASIRRANCSEIDLRSACLMTVNLRETDLRKADLRKAVFIDADLRGADLRGADLRGADLDGARLESALFSQSTLWQGDLNHPDEQFRRGLVEEADESLTIDEGLTPTGPARSREPRNGPRAAVAAAVFVAAMAAVLVPRLISSQPESPRVSGVRLEQPFLRITGSSTQVRVMVEVEGQVVQQFKTRELPVTIALKNLQPNNEVVAMVENLDPEGDASCELGLGSDIWISETSAADTTVIYCGARVR
ncbi:MAG: pentapeptide repeat-containing protein [Acidimicrobiales bacterium]